LDRNRDPSHLARPEVAIQLARSVRWMHLINGVEVLSQLPVASGETPVVRGGANADRRLVDAVRNDLRGKDGRATATAIRMI
jgi:hypothetical protein